MSTIPYYTLVEILRSYRVISHGFAKLRLGSSTPYSVCGFSDCALQRRKGKLHQRSRGMSHLHLLPRFVLVERPCTYIAHWAHATKIDRPAFPIWKLRSSAPDLHTSSEIWSYTTYALWRDGPLAAAISRLPKWFMPGKYLLCESSIPISAQIGGYDISIL